MRDLRVIATTTAEGQDIAGWQCSDCGWNFSIDRLANDADRKLVLLDFHAHDCAHFPPDSRKQAASSAGEGA